MIKRLALAVVFLLTACESAPVTPRYLPYNFTQQPSIPLNVSGITFVDQYQPPFVPPNVEHSFAIKPYDAIHKLVEDRVKPTGMSNANLRVTIVDASVKEESLDRTRGVKGAFYDDQSEKYKGNMAVLFEIYENGYLLPRAQFKLNVSRSGSVPESFSLQQRQDFYYDFTKAMIEQLNQQMEDGVARYFIQYQGALAPVMTAPNPFPGMGEIRQAPVPTLGH